MRSLVVRPGAGMVKGAHRGLAAIVLAALWTASPGPLRAQNGELDAVERLADEGRYEPARAALVQWIDEQWSSASRADRERGVWLRALLTVDSDAAALDYHRIVVEYPGGAHADHALVRLAHVGLARGDPEAARQHLGTLFRDYPESPLRVEARSLLVRLVGAAEPPPPPPVSPDPSPVSPPADDVVSSAPLDRTETDPFTIQLGAFATEQRALSVMLEARSEGLEPRLVQVEGSELLRVRLERFATRAEAEGRAAILRELGFQAVVSSDGALEEEVS